jgi:signal transduction histidine kinase
MNTDKPADGLTAAMRFLAGHLPSIRRAWAAASQEGLPEAFRRPGHAAFLPAFMDAYLPLLSERLREGEAPRHQACLEGWVKACHQRGLKHGDAVRVLIALKGVLIKILVARFRGEAELLRQACGRVERILDESRLIIADECHRLNAKLLRKANIALEDLNRQLKALGRFKDRLTANISHELKTPLASVRGYAEMMLGGMLGPVTPEQTKGLTVSLRSIDRLDAMIEELLTCSRMTERESPPLHPERFRLKDLVAECLETVRPDAEKKAIRLSAAPSTAGLMIHADKMKIHQAVTNLLSNAIKFNREGGRVDVSFAREGPEAVIRVRDTGIGVPEEARTRIFDAFYQLNSGPDRPYGGMGLGLAIALENVRLHGGRIAPRGEKAGGMTFEIFLPLTQDKAVYYQ